jgi:thioredoxin-dependent peroxiredoxin
MSELSVGDLAPDFTLPSDTGESIRLSDLRGKRVILYFCPKDDTPGCTAQACSFRDAMPQIEEKNGVVLGISPDGIASHQKFRTKYDLPFTLLADEDHAVAELYGAWGEKTNYGKTYMGLLRSQYVIDEQGRIASKHLKIKPEQSVPDALNILG